MLNVVFQLNLKKLIPNAWIFYYDSDLVVLVPGKETPVLNENLRGEITSILESFHLTACISDEYDDLFMLSVLYRANKRVLGLRVRNITLTSLIEYNDFKPADLILWAAVTQPDFNYMQFINNTVKRIFEYDKANKTELLNTLYWFISCNSSFVLTAKKMFVHKNTIIYRINRIIELFNPDLENMSTKIIIHHSCFLLKLFGQL
jgi:sugar diacid utilization regulator